MEAETRERIADTGRIIQSIGHQLSEDPIDAEALKKCIQFLDIAKATLELIQLRSNQ